MEAEYRDVQNELEMELRREWGPDILPNHEYVSRCISAYLYGASLASPKSNLDFFLTRSLEPKAATDLFNGYVGALLDPAKNLTVCAGTCSTVPGRVSRKRKRPMSSATAIP